MSVVPALAQGPGNRLTEPLQVHVDRLPRAWRELLDEALASPSFTALQRFVGRRLEEGAVIYPVSPFRALDLLAPEEVRVVILGQDPYHGPGQAQGLAFSVPDGFKRPPSLRNIFNEIAMCFGGDPAVFGNDLERWARQGVLLLNTSLTVEDGLPASHARQGWEAFTDAVIAAVAREPSPKVFMLWGAHAQAKQALLPPDGTHLVLTANHPSPLSARRPPVPFLGCAHFAQANRWLSERGRRPIAW
ncbi:MAG: uracil-DNA glycosylase [Pigmentiphaga sp.]|uniref:uracil-DNA glycosylase n=1 Tax=Pigmentiphaga sp. TaxID=1977564 RepID=UPI0029B45E15|nr:uracil-DNA glycosylase [Pigmentiphaga sp.]MDX3905737.1 uracil-DNA glycosylase [Pigmentiphaga sp.]